MSLTELLPENWKKSLSPHLDEIDRIGIALQNRADSGENILPNRSLVFRALDVPLSEVKVVIVGQDPYPNPKDACGLAFSVTPRSSGLPGSLLNIQKEILTDIGSTSTADGDLSRWLNHGVLLLNRVLTVKAGESASHSNLGWQQITESIVNLCAENGAIGVLWGNSAKELEGLFPQDHLVTGVHPSPLSAHRGFLGSKPFSRVNEILVKLGKSEIIW
jgi:uracil-DNA glycosylase